MRHADGSSRSHEQLHDCEVVADGGQHDGRRIGRDPDVARVTLVEDVRLGETHAAVRVGLLGQDQFAHLRG